MGINGLLPVLKPIGEAKTISDLREKRVGIDAHGWLHRSTYSCALELCRNEPTTAFVDYCMHRLRLLQSHGVTPVMVFDGAELPQKAATHAERRSSRSSARARADAAYDAGEINTAREWYQRGCSVTGEMAVRVFRAARGIGVECVIAPYEADAQLAWMMRAGYCDVVISEDSDLLVYGAGKVLYKFGKDGSGVLFQLERLGHLRTPNLGRFTQDMFMYMCVCAGCDFFKGVKGLGIRKAHTLIKRHSTLPRIIRAILLDTKLSVDRRSFPVEFARACLVFRHQTVLDMNTCKTVPLSPLDPTALELLPEGTVGRGESGEWNLDFLGKHLDSDLAKRVANGIVNPHTLEEYMLPTETTPIPRRPRNIIPQSRTSPSQSPQQRRPVSSNPNSLIGQPSSSNSAPRPPVQRPIPLPAFPVPPAPMHVQRRPVSDTPSFQPPSQSVLPRPGVFNPRREARRYSLAHPAQAGSAEESVFRPVAGNSSSVVWTKFKRASATVTTGTKTGKSSRELSSPSRRASTPRRNSDERRGDNSPSLGAVEEETEEGATADGINPAGSAVHNDDDGDDENRDKDDSGPVFNIDDDTQEQETQAREPALESNDALELQPVDDDVPATEPHDTVVAKPATDDDNSAHEDDEQQEEADNGTPGEKRPRSSAAVSRIMRRFASKPVDKRLKFAQPVATVLDERRKSDEASKQRSSGPPSPDHDSYLLFDEIDDLSREGAEDLKCINRRSEERTVNAEVKVNAKRSSPSTRRTSPPVTMRHRQGTVRLSGPGLSKRIGIAGMTPKRGSTTGGLMKSPKSPASSSPGIGTGTVKRQVLVSRFFAGGGNGSSSPSIKMEAKDKGKDKVRIDRRRERERRDDEQRHRTQPQSSETGEEGEEGDHQSDEESEARKTKKNRESERSGSGSVGTKKKTKESSNSPQKNSPQKSPLVRVEAAMVAGECAAERRKAQKRKIDNFRRGATGKKIRVGSG